MTRPLQLGVLAVQPTTLGHLHVQEVLRLSLLTGEEEVAHSVQQDIQRSHSSAATLPSGDISQQALEAAGWLARAASSREPATPCLCLHAISLALGTKRWCYFQQDAGANLGNNEKAGTSPVFGACWPCCTIQHWRQMTTWSGLSAVCFSACWCQQQ